MKTKYKNKIFTEENDVMVVGVQTDDGDYIMWQRGTKADTGSDLNFE